MMITLVDPAALVARTGAVSFDGANRMRAAI